MRSRAAVLIHWTSAGDVGPRRARCLDRRAAQRVSPGRSLGGRRSKFLGGDLAASRRSRPRDTSGRLRSDRAGCARDAPPVGRVPVPAAAQGAGTAEGVLGAALRRRSGMPKGGEPVRIATCCR